MDHLKEIQDLYSQIPKFKCKMGCTDCCGPVPFAKEEWKLVPVKKEGKSLTCPYASAEGCEIYPFRPFMCRIFGTISKLKCPHRCGPERMLSDAKGEELTDAYLKIMGKENR